LIGRGAALDRGEILDVLRAGGRILTGRIPSLSFEITRECPLRCPGCYAFADNHLGEAQNLRDVRDYKGQELVDRILRIVDESRPVVVSLVGGEPLVRFRELSVLLPELAARGIHTQVVTSAVRPIPPEWRSIPSLTISVSVDGLQPEHDARRKPATYERILKNIQGHSIIVHCTITGQIAGRPGYIRDFLAFWSAREEVRKIWMSLFTPQIDEESVEVLSPAVRVLVIEELRKLRADFPKLNLPPSVLDIYLKPPESPSACIFARSTRTISADLKTVIAPCQIGGNPDCSQCGCLASAAMGAIAAYRLPVGVRLGTLYNIAESIGRSRGACARVRRRLSRLLVPLPTSLPGNPGH
jgi:MoaA/NifB/PqqE/SkfB family radical SAM enzyme